MDVYISYGFEFYEGDEDELTDYRVYDVVTSLSSMKTGLVRTIGQFFDNQVPEDDRYTDILRIYKTELDAEDYDRLVLANDKELDNFILVEHSNMKDNYKVIDLNYDELWRQFIEYVYAESGEWPADMPEVRMLDAVSEKLIEDEPFYNKWLAKFVTSEIIPNIK